jgi:DNA repair protein RecN (Recombination protein N)
VLTRITIRNLVIVRELDLALGAGMSALTGETGAGKSILVDALSLALGAKADSGMIRGGADKADITAAFDLADHPDAAAWLAQHDLDADDECLLRRVLVRSGRSRAYVNGSPVTQALLAELGALLVAIHGQHAHQALLRPAAQRELIDGFGALQAQVAAVAEHYRHWRAAREQRDALREARADRANRLDYLQFQVGELEDLPLAPDTIAEIDAERDRLSHAERLLGDSAQLLALLDDSEPSLTQSLGRAATMVRDLCQYDAALVEVADLLDNALIQVEEASGALRHYQDRVELDPERLAQLDDQVSRLHEVARKHHCRADELAGLLADLQREMETLQHADDRLHALEREVETRASAYRKAADTLSAARREAAARLAQTVTDSMQTLGMRGGAFSVRCEAGKQPTAHGSDEITFDVAANPGQAPAPLARVASGGELSRISLAIQVATAGCGTVPTLIFDEVDVGIGGATAEIVGQLLRRLGGERQVLCVTHLAQVAAQAHGQLRVHKLSDGATTETRIDALDAANRIDEIARMLGGVDITEQTRAHAAEMIGRAQQAS